MHTLNISNNYVETLEDFDHLTELAELSVLDMANNHIDDPLIVQVVGKMPELRVLNLMGNPVIRKIPAYRKTMILACVKIFSKILCIHLLHTYLFFFLEKSYIFGR